VNFRNTQGLIGEFLQQQLHRKSTMEPITPPHSSSSSLSWSSWSSPSSLLSREPRLRIAIIGAGLGGLTLGQLLQDATNVQVTVYERSLESDNLSGYRIMLSNFVLKRLQASLRGDIWARVALSLGISPKDGHELTFMKRWPPSQELFLLQD